MHIFALGGMTGRRTPLVNASTHRAAVYPHQGPDSILSTAGYVIFRSGAGTMLSQPLRAPTDIQLSLVNAVTSCRQMNGTPAPCRFVPPPNQYGPKFWLFGQDNDAAHGGLQGSSHADTAK